MVNTMRKDKGSMKKKADQKHQGAIENRLNILRAGVLGANDGIISTAGLVIGVASATNNIMTILVAGIAGLLAGSLSMAGGEYASVSTQKDVEQAEEAKERLRLANDFKGESAELVQYYEDKGLSHALATQVAAELMKVNPLGVKLKTASNITLGDYVSPWNAAISSMFSFTLGAVIPLIFIFLLPVHIKIVGTFAVVSVALALTGYVSAALGGAPRLKALIRNVVVGMLTMLVTYGLGQFAHI